MSRGKVEEEVSEEIELPGWERKIDRKGVAAKGEEEGKGVQKLLPIYSFI